MLIDLKTYDGPTDVHADVVVVGGGAAGLTLTRELLAGGKTVVVLESGGTDFDEGVQALGVGADLGMEYYPLEDSRLRFLGGTTNIWGGRSVPLCPIDFEYRDWVPHSGWPISYADLKPYYEQAHADLELGAYEYSDELWGQLNTHAPDFDESLLQTMFWRFDEQRERFAQLAPSELASNSNCRIFLNANVTGLNARENADGLAAVTAQSLSGVSIRVQAENYVLATGAVENARLLLASDEVESSGIGNRHDQVGRYFMEHPHARLATVDHSDASIAFAVWSAFRKRFRPEGGIPIAPVLMPAPELQKREAILNTALTFKLQRPPERGAPLNRRLYLSLKHQLNPTKTGRALWHGYRSGKKALQRSLRDRFEQMRINMGLTGLHIMVRAEQAPNPASRVVLSPQCDALGVRQADLDWQLNAQDTHTLQVLSRVLGDEFQRLGVGRVQKAQWLEGIEAQLAVAWPVDPSIGNHPIGGYHHMGTTRMSDDPRNGVVDLNCRVHNYANLYIAGSSVFPTGGWANPTLTIIALARRLGRQLVDGTPGE